MLIIYRGFGCLVPVVLGFFAIVGALGGTTGLAVALVMAAGVLWFLSDEPSTEGITLDVIY